MEYNNYWNWTWGTYWRITEYVGKKLKRWVKHTYICLLHEPYESITSDPIRLKSKISKEYHHHTTSGTTTKGCRVLRSMRYLYIDWNLGNFPLSFSNLWSFISMNPSIDPNESPLTFAQLIIGPPCQILLPKLASFLISLATT